MLGLLYDVFLVVAIVAAGAFILGRPLWVMFTDRPDDISTIKAQYEGIAGRAGPNCTVAIIKRTGFRFGGRSYPPARIYHVELSKPDGQTVGKNVSVSSSFFGSGDVTET